MPSTMDISALPWMNSNTRKKVPTTAALIKKSARVPRNAYSSEAFYVGLLETVRVFVSYVIQHKDSKPEAGLVTAAVLYILNSRPQGYLFKQVCLLPKSVVQDEQHYRLLTSCAVQLDSSQLTCSLATMMPHMLQSEASFGPTAAIMDVALVASMTSAMQGGLLRPVAHQLCSCSAAAVHQQHAVPGSSNTPTGVLDCCSRPRESSRRQHASMQHVLVPAHSPASLSTISPWLTLAHSATHKASIHTWSDAPQCSMLFTQGTS